MFPKSIRKKITLGFYFLLICIVTMAALTYGIVREVGKKIEYIEIIDDFLNTTLEVRRFEKNYFLDNKEEDFQDNKLFLLRLQKLLVENISILNTLMTKSSYNELWDRVSAYKDSMQRLHEMNKAFTSVPVPEADLLQLESVIRRIGKELTGTAEVTSRRERDEIKRLLGATGRILLFSVMVFSILCLTLAGFLGRNVVRSLKVLEKHTRQISHGDFKLTAVGAVDEEIKTLLHAFNRMTWQLRMHQKQLVQSEKLASLGTLLSGVAHELNNPLSNVSSSAQILSEEFEEGDPVFKRNLINQILDQTDRARDIVRSLLEFSRVSEFCWQELPLRELVEETIVLVRGQVPTHVEIKLDIPEDLLITVDKQRMQQVFLNLLKNAIDVLGEDGKIWVSGRDISKPGARREIEILVEDNGPGIPEDIKDKIFDPFFTTKDVGHGSGLGLFIVHDIVEMHGGSLRVESRDGAGTTIIVWIPDREEERR